jgi:hypothetical protein
VALSRLSACAASGLPSHFHGVKPGVHVLDAKPQILLLILKAGSCPLSVNR